MPDSAPIWVLADAADARRFLAAAPAEAQVLALTPVARAALVGTAAVQLDPRLRFTDWAQARTVVAVRRARRRLVAAAAALPGARAIHREIALDHFLRAAYTAYRLWFSLGAARIWMIPEGESWRRCETRDQAYRALLGHMLAPHIARQEAALGRTPPWPRFYRGLRRWVLRRACRGRVCFVSGARKGMFGLLDAVAAESVPARIVVVQTVGDGWRDYLRLVRNAWRTMRGARFLDVSLLAAPDGKASASADRLIASVGDTVIEAAFRYFSGPLAHRLAQAAPALADAADIAAAVRPRHYLSADASRISDWALAEACGAAGVTRWVLSRNTHVPARSRMAEDTCRDYLFARYPDGMVDKYLFWTPHGAAAARSVLPRQAWGAIEPVAAVPVIPATAPEPREPGKRRVLVADSYGSWWFPHNWAFQTSDEFLESLKHLIAAVERMPDTELRVRAKRKLELDAGDYDRLLPAGERVSMKIRDVSIWQDLAECDVLVAFRSTAIEEALHARKPALLWGGTSRYRYLPARTKPPTPADRAAIYSADSAAELERLLPAILDAHAGRPLTDSEIAAHVWPGGTATVPDLARRMLAATAPPLAQAQDHAEAVNAQR